MKGAAASRKNHLKTNHLNTMNVTQTNTPSIAIFVTAIVDVFVNDCSNTLRERLQRSVAIIHQAKNL